MLKIVAVALLVLLGVVLVFAATRPDTLRVKRVATIQAPPDKIFPLVSDFKRWGAWSPYENKDPNLKRSYGEASAPGRVAIKLDFTRPFEAHNMVVVSLAPAGGATEVNMDRMVGKDFEVGLANLKAAAEK